MSTPFECERTLFVQADFDGELDAAQSAALLQHIGECTHCQSAQAQLARSRDILRRAPRYSAPPHLREVIQRDAPAGAQADPAAHLRADRVNVHGLPRQRFSRGSVLAWATSAAAAAVVATVLLLSPSHDDVSVQLVSNHLRALQMDSHLIDVVSTDHHTVKPWFAGKVSFAPPVKQLGSAGYLLKGGRVDVVGNHTAAVLVYQAGRHLVEVYVWPAGEGGSVLERARSTSGFNLRQWTEGDLTLWCVSDMAEEELDRFVEHWRGA